MTTAAIEARTVTLARLERAAGQAFGCEDDGSSSARTAFLTPATIALTTLAITVAATITYFV